MGWTAIEAPHQATYSREYSAVRCSLGRLCNGQVRLKLIFPAGIQEQLPWLRPGGMVDVLLGDGEDAGKLRVTRNGPILIMKTAGRNGGALSSSLCVPNGLPNEVKRDPVTVAHTIGADWIEVSLPAWARPVTKGASVAEQPQQATVSLSAVSPTPAAVPGRPKGSVLVDRVGASRGAGGALKW